MNYNDFLNEAKTIQSKKMQIHKDYKEYAFTFSYPPPQSLYKIDISPYLNELENINYEFTWKRILMASLNMSIEDLMIGNYENEFPKLQQAVNISQSIPIKFVDWLCQSFIISFSIKHLLK